jgi:hypothetical protein
MDYKPAGRVPVNPAALDQRIDEHSGLVIPLDGARYRCVAEAADIALWSELRREMPKALKDADCHVLRHG